MPTSSMTVSVVSRKPRNPGMHHYCGCLMHLSLALLQRPAPKRHYCPGCATGCGELGPSVWLYAQRATNRQPRERPLRWVDRCEVRVSC